MFVTMASSRSLPEGGPFFCIRWCVTQAPCLHVRVLAKERDKRPTVTVHFPTDC
jgi:hypothetical protein